MNKVQRKKCAHCGEVFVLSPENKEFWPFCSKRCKMIDLGNWLQEKYVVKEDAAKKEEDKK